MALLAPSRKPDKRIAEAWQTYREACREARLHRSSLDAESVEEWAWARLQDELAAIKGR